MNIHNSEESKGLNKKKEVLIYSIEAPFVNHVIGDLLKSIRKRRRYSQTRLGRIIGVNKAQISKLESNQANLTFSTLIKVFVALKAKVTIKVELYEEEDIKNDDKRVNGKAVNNQKQADI